VGLFDCVIPTRLARHGAALVQGDRWNLKNAQFRRFYTTGWNFLATLVSTLAVLMSSGAIAGNFGLHSEHSQRYRIDSLHPKDSAAILSDR